MAFFLVALLGCWILAGLLWGFSTPERAPVVLQESTPTEIAEGLAYRKLFAASASEPTMTADSSWRLLGIVASEDPQSARVIVRRDGDANAQVLGIGESSDGATLSHIKDDEAIFMTAGRTSRLILPRTTEQSSENPSKPD